MKYLRVSLTEYWMNKIRIVWFTSLLFGISCSGINHNHSKETKEEISRFTPEGFNSHLLDLDSLEVAILKESVDTQSGNLNGKIIEFTEKGDTIFIGEYKNGKRDGQFSFFANNVLVEEVLYQNDIKNGFKRNYDTLGRLREFGFYKEGDLVYYKSISEDNRFERSLMTGIAAGKIIGSKDVQVNDTIMFNYKVEYTILDPPSFLFTLILNNDTIETIRIYDLTYSVALHGFKKGSNNLKLFVKEIDSASNFYTGETYFEHTFNAR
ncbi:MAG: hypothetical protein ABJG41_12840 [Cyclobacteriaceae bacterium]